MMFFTGGLFELFFVVFMVVFVVMFGLFVFQMISGVRQWNRNNHAPRLTVDAIVVSRRTNVTHHHHDGHTHRSASYYVTFQVDSGDRMELNLSGPEYGLLAEGDRGKLTFQGTRYLGFERML